MFFPLPYGKLAVQAFELSVHGTQFSLHIAREVDSLQEGIIADIQTSLQSISLAKESVRDLEATIRHILAQRSYEKVTW
jgi:hypothetical protein